MDEVPAGEGGLLFEGDCLELAARMDGGSFDLMYSDPPFFTKRDFEGKARRGAKLGGNGVARGGGEKAGEQAETAREALKFTDRWLSAVSNKNERKEYLAWLEPRLVALKRLLKPCGVFLLHLDWHAVHYAKVMCDELFGEENFQNELIWYYQTGGASKGRFSRKHDTILFYSNGAGFYFDGKAIAIPRTAKAMKRARSGAGARIAATDTHKNPDDVLVVPALNPMAIERTGYPTQKPVELLEMLITALCPTGGLVGDFFCGSGTTLVAAKKVGRRFVGGDVSGGAVALARKRVGEVESKSDLRRGH